MEVQPRKNMETIQNLPSKFSPTISRSVSSYAFAINAQQHTTLVNAHFLHIFLLHFYSQYKHSHKQTYSTGIASY